jgi:hypothetical protein
MYIIGSFTNINLKGIFQLLPLISLLTHLKTEFVTSV